MIRDANAADLPQILAIFNEVVATSTAIYRDDPTTLEERAQWFAARRQSGFPVLVCEREGAVLGFSSFGDFRGAFPGYRHTIEHSVHVRADARGRGLGSALVEALFPRAEALDMHVMIGAIDASNEASLRFHERLGFAPVGHLREVGRKFGRWLDLVFMQKTFAVRANPRK